MLLRRCKIKQMLRKNTGLKQTLQSTTTTRIVTLCGSRTPRRERPQIELKLSIKKSANPVTSTIPALSILGFCQTQFRLPKRMLTESSQYKFP